MIRRILLDNRGATIIEFAMLAPALMLVLLGLFDMGYNFYVQSQLQGSIQKAARDSGIERANLKLDVIDKRVMEAVHKIVPDAQVTFQRRAYSSFSDVAKAEDYTDINDDGLCNDGEPFEDANGNGQWDDDRGSEGLGGARDAVLYVVKVEHKRAFGAAGFVGLPDTVTTNATTVLRNQPYNLVSRKMAAGNCL